MRFQLEDLLVEKEKKKKSPEEHFAGSSSLTNLQAGQTILHMKN
jgi:hypothetical protein